MSFGNNKYDEITHETVLMRRESHFDNGANTGVRERQKCDNKRNLQKQNIDGAAS